jgi:DNA repair exonuclease SbcCD ATPase subunit
LDREKINLKSFKEDIASLENHLCPSCGQKFHNKKQVTKLESKRKQLEDTTSAIVTLEANLIDLELRKQELGPLGPCPTTFYEQESDAFEHRSSMSNLLSQITTKQDEADPYVDQIKDMQETALISVSYDVINELTKIKEHQEFLLKLLTNKDSFIRKRIIDQNLNYLNARLHNYLTRIGLPHTVKFLNDLTVSIEELGRELDFDNLSRGERNRLILSLSWAFRDVWESLYTPINLLFIDEVVDSGMDASGVDSSLAILKKMSRDGNKSVWLVSHKDELAGRVNNILTVVKENGFTNYNSDVEIR